LTWPSAPQRSAWYKHSIPRWTLEEMLMRNSRRRVEQLNLFHPPRTTPSWTTLPPEVREEVLALLAQLFREHHHRQIMASSKGGTPNE
jgi:hypothetical protein